MEQVEHRLFSFISINWRGRPLRTYKTVISLIGNTTNRGGLVGARPAAISANFPIGKKVSAKELDELKIEDDFHGDWNYAIRPRTLFTLIERLPHSRPLSSQHVACEAGSAAGRPHGNGACGLTSLPKNPFSGQSGMPSQHWLPSWLNLNRDFPALAAVGDARSGRLSACHCHRRVVE